MVRDFVESIAEADMESTATFVGISVAIFFALFVAVASPLVLSGKRVRAAQDTTRARRLADARMNARLLRLNL